MEKELVDNKLRTRRSQEQLARDRARISALVLKGHDTEAIIKIIKAESGYELSPTQIGTDIAQIRRQWLSTQEINYAALLAQELDRLDALEKELWERLRSSASPRIKRTIERWIKDMAEADIDPDEAEKLAAKISETTESGAVDPVYFGHIMRVQQERRKMLGLYAPEIKHTTQEVTIKGYKIISPSDWDEPVEGQYERIND